VRDLFSESHDALKKIRSVKSQVDDLTARLKEAKAADGVDEAAKALTGKLTAIEQKIYQTKNESMQDPLNFQPMLDNRIANLYGIVLSTDAKPTAVAHEHYEALKTELQGYEQELEGVMASELSAFNQVVSGKNIPPVMVPGS
jgi:DNA repair exonuclease SbcCD ATPase subunit